MEITIEGPEFLDQEDENLFFESMYRLESFIKVVGCGRHLNIYMCEKPLEKDFLRLLVLCQRWRIDIEPFQKFKEIYSPDSLLWSNDHFHKA